MWEFFRKFNMGSAPKTSVFRHFSLLEVAKNTAKENLTLSQTYK